jgi:AraC family transcriptional regulator
MLQGTVRIGRRRDPAGLMRQDASADHTLLVHASAPMQVTCQVGQRYTVEHGEVCVMPVGLEESWSGDAPSESIELRLADAVVRTTAADMGLDPDRAGIAPQYHLRDARIAHIAWALDLEAQAGFPNGRLYRESLGIALAAHLLASHRTQTPANASGLPARQLRRVLDYIEAHLRDELSLSELAGVGGASPSHFRALFRRSLGVPVHQYVIRRRVERARELLASSELTAAQIAFDVGFAHQSHMARCMRRILGVTPSAIARSSR